MDMNQAADDCVSQETVITDVKLAQAYVPFQKLCSVFSPNAALMKGTAFPPLYDRWDRKGFRVYEDE